MLELLRCRDMLDIQLIQPRQPQRRGQYSYRSKAHPQVIQGEPNVWHACFACPTENVLSFRTIPQLSTAWIHLNAQNE